ncbi:MAG TPA: FtsX-like permease family protein [Candidatus Acidoferrales bacterium]|nr:FtsX-like permease family protein [Candidatus Acidoferrales bacterium]
MGFLRFCRAFLLRPLRQEPLRAALTALAVALGVAVVLAIELAGRSAAGSFHSSLETLVGSQDLEITAIGGVPDRVYAELATLPYPLHLTPRMEDFAVVRPGGEVLPLVGLDLVSGMLEPGVRLPEPGGTPAAGSRASPDWERSVWIGAGLGRAAGDSIRLQINDQDAVYPVAGVLPDLSDSGELPRAVVMDIGLAQRLLRRQGRIDRILVRLPAGSDAAQYESLLAARFPGLQVARAGARTRENRKMLAAFRWNLRLLSYIALIVGSFLIYNTISVSVVRRRREIGVLRALGATRIQVLLAFLAEAALFGMAGAAAGIPLARAMAAGAVRLLGVTVESLYVSSAPAPVALTPGLVAIGVSIALALALLSALAPALEAARVSPVEAMERGAREYHARVHKRRDAAIAVLLSLAALGSSRLPPIGATPVFGYLAALLLIVAATLAMPAIVSASMAASGALLRSLGFAGVEPLLAGRSLAASLRRSSTLTAALATAVAMMASVGIMVASFRRTVVDWMNQQLPADLYLSPAVPPAPDRHPTLDPQVEAIVARVPGVAAAGSFRSYSISFGGLPATLGATDLSIVARTGRLHFLSGNRAEILSELAGHDAVVVSEPFANKHHLHPGDFISLPLHIRPARFRVAGVFYDYGSEAGLILIDRATLANYMPLGPPTNLAVILSPGVDPEAARRDVAAALSGHRVGIFLNREIRAQAIRIFDRTFAITYALEAVAIAVAVIGIAGALLAVVIDRRRELGLLRFLGASQPQVRRLIVCEAALLGLLASLAGLALGVLLSWILIFVINKQSFGWTIQFHWPLALLAAGLGGVFVATLLAALYPARAAARLVPIHVVHEE